VKTLHIISFDVPWPANYGGVIDVFYKLEQLHKAGVKIHLHCFEYGRGQQKELNRHCAEVHYYKRSTSPFHQLSSLPFIVNTRVSEELVKRLQQDKHPILFEGLHTCGILNDKRLDGRLKIYRESNIEHDYYRHLAKAESNLLRRLYFLAEAKKLEKFEMILKHAGKMLVVSQADTAYLQAKFPGQDIEYLPSFHPYESVVSETGTGDFILYHGNLSIAENVLGAEYLIEHVFSKTDYTVKIAGLNPGAGLKNLIQKHKHIEVIENPSDEVLQQLIRQAQVNCLYTHQATGLKLKLLNALFAGRHCLVNDKMLHGTGLEKACEVANEPEQFIDKLRVLMKEPFTQAVIDNRKELLKNFDVRRNAQRIVELLH
jgi:glycosyltransferase involved in cell wall biosynthesis